MSSASISRPREKKIDNLQIKFPQVETIHSISDFLYSGQRRVSRSRAALGSGSCVLQKHLGSLSHLSFVQNLIFNKLQGD